MKRENHGYVSQGASVSRPSAERENNQQLGVAGERPVHRISDAGEEGGSLLSFPLGGRARASPTTMSRRLLFWP